MTILSKQVVWVLLGTLVLACDCRPSNPAHKSGMNERSELLANPSLPGIKEGDKSLDAELAGVLQGKGPAYKPRTHHLHVDGRPKYTNRLIRETSPYLLQHAHNPVNWFAWSEEAFERAKRENKPVFLSVGYSTCHWCHVMERESFEDEEIAAYLNQHFICVKVDREERPDVDAVYMTAVNMLTGRGGWPMTVVMTDEKQPFFAGTYFPPRAGARGSRQGLIEILKKLIELYSNERQEVIAQAKELSQRMQQRSGVAPAAGVAEATVIKQTVSQLASSFDEHWGGFGRRPKFPQPSRLALMLRYARRTQDKAVLNMVEVTLDKMAEGGLHDQIGGGFHRYSVDDRWLVPHFEKMLYDNAQLAIAYLEAWQVLDKAEYKEIVDRTLNYVAREMRSQEGAFYSATDADSPTPEGHEEEGWFFTWTPQEIAALLDEDAARVVMAVFGVSDAGNFEGRNIFHRPEPLEKVALSLGRSPEELRTSLEASIPVLYAARAKRSPPLRDEKILVEWNGLMISAFAKAGFAFADPTYTEIATKAARFILEKMRGKGGRLLRSYIGGSTTGNAYLGDYAAFIQACLDLYEATGALEWLNAAESLQADLDAHFADTVEGGYFVTRDDHEKLLLREKPDYDGAIPSGNSISALNLLRLATFSGKDEYLGSVEALFQGFSQLLARHPQAVPLLLVALDYYYDVPLEIALVLPDSEADTNALHKALGSSFVPNRSVVVTKQSQVPEQEQRIPWLANKAALQGVATAYVCEKGRCELPTSDPAVFKKQLAKVRPYP